MQHLRNELLELKARLPVLFLSRSIGVDAGAEQPFGRTLGPRKGRACRGTQQSASQGCGKCVLEESRFSACPPIQIEAVNLVPPITESQTEKNMNNKLAAGALLGFLFVPLHPPNTTNSAVLYHFI